MPYCIAGCRPLMRLFRSSKRSSSPPNCCCADTFDRAVPYDALTLATARGLKETYWVSIQAIIRAANDRGRISRARYTSLYKQLSARGWRTDEPVPIEAEAPRLWPEILRVHREQHQFTDADFAGVARVTPENARRPVPS